MPVDRLLWSGHCFTEEDVPAWPCPTCGQGALQLQTPSLHQAPSAWTLRNKDHDDWEPEMWEARFSCLMVCPNENCRESVAVGGEASKTEGSENLGSQFVSRYRPCFFFPALHMFDIPGQCPGDVAHEVVAAFGLFFCDPSASGNHLRNAVELIMDHLKIPRVGGSTNKDTGGKRRKRLDLHRRIDRFRKKAPVLADRLEAIKWLGNAGSHGSSLTPEDVFDGFDLIEDFINEHFEKKGKKIGAITKRILRRKKPRSH